MSADKIYAIIGYAIKMSSVSLIDIYLTLCRLIVEICLFTAAFKRNIIYINSDNITVKQLCFNKRCAASGKLVED